MSRPGGLEIRPVDTSFSMTSSAAAATMPGSFHCDTILPPKLDINVGAKSHFFQPPDTPSASSSLHRSTCHLSTPGVDPKGSRKRRWDDSLAVGHRSSPTTLQVTDARSPPPLVNTRYELSGGLDPPTAAAFMAMEVPQGDYRASPDIHMRGGRGFRGLDLASDGYFPTLSSVSPPNNVRNSRLEVSRDGLGKVVYGVMGMAGKMLEFCKATAFRGFYAGGGQGYRIEPPPDTMGCDHSVWLDASRGDMSPASVGDKDLLPGKFPEEDYIAEYMSQDHATPSHPSKKIQREKGVGELSASWVVIDRNPSREASPSRLSHRKLPSTAASTRRPALKHGRRPLLPASRPSPGAHAGLPAWRSDRPASSASMRSPLSSPKAERPLSADVQRHAAKLKKREIEDDANLKRFNQQLKALIREGKEALGTRFEVQEVPMAEYDTEEKYYCGMDKG